MRFKRSHGADILLGFLKCLAMACTDQSRFKDAIAKNLRDLRLANQNVSTFYTAGVVKGFPKS